jgi:hypothetical protein
VHRADSTRNFTDSEAAKKAGENDAWSTADLYDTIEAGDFPSWTVGIATMTEEEAANYRYDILDLTKDWLNVTYHEVQKSISLVLCPSLTFVIRSDASISPRTRQTFSPRLNKSTSLRATQFQAGSPPPTQSCSLASSYVVFPL